MTMHSLEIPKFDYPHHEFQAAEKLDGYNLSPREMTALEASLVDNFRDSYPDVHGVVVFLVRPDSPYANFARTSETIAFPGYDSSIAMENYEENSLFLYTVNLDGTGVANDRYIAHVKRVVKARNVSPVLAETIGTGLEVIDDRLSASAQDESALLEEIMSINGIKDFRTCMNVTSNMSVPGIEPTLDNPYALISYKAVFEIAQKYGISHILAYVNKAATKSLGKLGVRTDLIGGKEFHLPIPEHPGEYDMHYLAVSLPDGPENQAAFSKLNPTYPMRKLIAEREVPIFEIA